MRITKKDLKIGEITVHITNNEDLWYLSHIITPGDSISGSTERKIKIGNDENAKFARKFVFLKIIVEKNEYVPEQNNLRILGTITEGPEDVSLGSHHSFTASIGDNITIQKDSWTRFETEKLRESECEQRKILLVLFDREEARFARLTRSGYEELSELKGEVQKKAVDESKNDNFYKKISEQISEYCNRHKIEQVIIGSPSFWKEYLVKELPEELRKKCILTTISGVDKTGFSELLQRDELKKSLELEKTSQELIIIEEILTAIRKDNACYGWKDTKEKVEQGSVSKIAVTENYIKQMRDKHKYQEIDELLQLAESIKADIRIITGKDPSSKLDSLGGIAGILRW